MQTQSFSSSFGSISRQTTTQPGSSSNSSHGNTKFPLAADYFPSIQLSPMEIANYELQMNAIVQQALQEYDHHEKMGRYPIYPAPWAAIATTGDLVAIQRQNTATPSRSHVRVFGRIEGDYKDFIDFFYSDTTNEFMDWNRFVFGCAVDAAVLVNIQNTTHQTTGSLHKLVHQHSPHHHHQYLGIKWACLQPSTMHRKRDICFIEYLTHTTDSKGRDVAIRVQSPVQIPECPLFPRSMKVKRMLTRTVSIVRAVPDTGNEKLTQVFMLSDHESSDYFAASGYIKKLMHALRHMSARVDAQRISSKGMVSRSNWVPKSSRKACSICDTPFKAVRRRHHCRLCGDVICRSCLVERDVPKPSIATSNSKTKSSKKKSVKFVKTKFCVLCVNKMRDTTDDDVRMWDLPAPSIASLAPSVISVRTTDKEEPTEKGGEEEEEGEEGETRISRASMWSEAESERGNLSFYSCSETTESRPSSFSSQSDISMEKISFINTLDMIPDDAMEAGEAESTKKTKDDEKNVNEQNQAEPHQSSNDNESNNNKMEEPPAILEVSEVIDTTDMIPLKIIQQQQVTSLFPSASLPSNDGYEFYSASFHRQRIHSGGGSASSTSNARSLGQCLAEQEELLRRMVLAASATSTTSTSSTSTMRTPTLTPTNQNAAVTPPQPTKKAKALAKMSKKKNRGKEVTLYEP